MRVVNASCVSDDTPKHSSTPALSSSCRAGEARGNFVSGGGVATLARGARRRIALTGCTSRVHANQSQEQHAAPELTVRAAPQPASTRGTKDASVVSSHASRAPPPRAAIDADEFEPSARLRPRAQAAPPRARRRRGRGGRRVPARGGGGARRRAPARRRGARGKKNRAGPRLRRGPPPRGARGGRGRRRRRGRDRDARAVRRRAGGRRGVRVARAGGGLRDDRGRRRRGAVAAVRRRELRRRPELRQPALGERPPRRAARGPPRAPARRRLHRRARRRGHAGRAAVLSAPGAGEGH